MPSVNGYFTVHKNLLPCFKPYDHYADRMPISDQTRNRLTVLKAIRRHAPISRSELPAISGLSGGAITKMTSDLLKRGLIVERRESGKRNGRPRAYLEINTAGAIVIGASIEGYGPLTTAFVDLAGKRLFALDVERSTPATLIELASGIADGLEQAIAASPFARDDISRIGIALPAVVDSVRGNVHFMTTFPVGPVPFAAIIEQRLGIPVTIENDTEGLARAEHWFGVAQELDTFTLLHVGFSVGSAKYVDGVPKSGANGLNSEMGHIKTNFDAQARRCFCGAKGCLTAYSSMFGILQHMDLLADAPFPPVESLNARFEQFLDRAERGDVLALGLLELAGFHLGVIIANHINANDPGNVLLLASHARFLTFAAEKLNAAIRENVLPGLLACTNITFGTSNKDWRWKGTAALALEQAYLGNNNGPTVKA